MAAAEVTKQSSSFNPSATSLMSMRRVKAPNDSVSHITEAIAQPCRVECVCVCVCLFSAFISVFAYLQYMLNGIDDSITKKVCFCRLQFKQTATVL